MQWDVAVVGGGVAGLAAAGRISQGGRRVVLLEARNRLGGRIHTVPDQISGHPVELGAEFVQGTPGRLLEIVHRGKLRLVEIPERHQRRGQGRPRALPGIEELVDRLLDQDQEFLPDIPVAQLMRRRASGFTPEELRVLTAYLEGFHAADLERFGTAALAENQRAEKNDEGRLSRMAGGYGELVTQLASELDPTRNQALTGTVVSRLRWAPGQVEVHVRTGAGKNDSLIASQALLTVPLTALKTPPNEVGALLLDPAPPGWAHALAALEMGHARRIVLRFQTPWWLERDVAWTFVHGNNEPFPVWWTSSPPELPFLTGWIGGPSAIKLAGQTEQELLRLAVISLASIFGVDSARIRGSVTAVYSQDWSSDPFSRGAYSYGGVGAATAREHLRRPIAKTLFLAGEALAEEGHNATVAGALGDGLRAAELILHSRVGSVTT